MSSKVRNDWGNPTDWETVCRRNAGRRHYNGVRGLQRALRRREVARLLLEYGRLAGWLTHGLQARIARELGVSQGTVSRDVRFLMEQGRRACACPLCGSRVAPAGGGR
jgi:hypothetical protein